MEASDGCHANRDFIEDLFASVWYALDESRSSFALADDRCDGDTNTKFSQSWEAVPAAHPASIADTGRDGSPLSTTTHRRSGFDKLEQWPEVEPVGVSLVGQGLCEEDRATLKAVLEMTGRSQSHARILERTIQTNAEENLRSLRERRRRAAAARRASVGYVISRRASFDHSVECKLAQARAQGLTNSRRLAWREREATRRLQEFLHECLGEYEKERIREERRRVSSAKACDAALAEKILDLRWSRFCARLEEDAFGLVEARDLGNPSRFARDSTVNARGRSSCTSAAAVSTAAAVTSRLETVLARAGLLCARIARIVGLRPCGNSGGMATPGGPGERLLVMRELEKSHAFLHGEVAVVAGKSPLEVAHVVRRAALCRNRWLEAALPLSVLPAADSSPSGESGAPGRGARASSSFFSGNQSNVGQDYGESNSRDEEREGVRTEGEEGRCCAMVVAAEPGVLLSSSPITWTLRAPFGTTNGNGLMRMATDGLCRGSAQGGGSDNDTNREAAASDRNLEGERIGWPGDCRANVGVLGRGLRGKLARDLTWISAAPVGCRIYYCLEEALWEASRLEDSRRRGQSAAHDQARTPRNAGGRGNAEGDKPARKLTTGEEGSGHATVSAIAGKTALFARSVEEILAIDVFRGGSEISFRGESPRSERSSSGGYNTSSFNISESDNDGYNISEDNDVPERAARPRGARLWESVVLNADLQEAKAATASFLVSNVIDGRRFRLPQPDADDQRHVGEEGGSRARRRVSRSDPHADAPDILVARVNEPGVPAHRDEKRWERKNCSVSPPASVEGTGLGADGAWLQQPLWQQQCKDDVGEGKEGRNRCNGQDDLRRPTTTNHATGPLHFVPARVEQLLGMPQCREFVDALPPLARARVLARYGEFPDRFAPIGRLYVPLKSPDRPAAPRERSGTEKYSKQNDEEEEGPCSEPRQEFSGVGTDLSGDSPAEVAGDGIEGIATAASSSSGSGLRSGPLLGALVHPLPVRAVRELLQVYVATTRAFCAVNVDGGTGVSRRLRSSGLFVPRPALPGWMSFDVGDEDASFVDDGGSGCKIEGDEVVCGSVMGRWGPGLPNPATTPPSAIDVLPDYPFTPSPRSCTHADASTRVETQEASLGGDAHDGGDTAARYPGRHTECDGGGLGVRVLARARGGRGRLRDGVDVSNRRHEWARREENAVAFPIAASILVPFSHTCVAVLAAAAGGFSGSGGGARAREKEGTAGRDLLPGAMTSLLLQVEVETPESARAREDEKAAKCSDAGGEMHAGVCAWRACVADVVVGSVLCAVHARLRVFLDNEAAQAGCASEALCFLPPNGSRPKHRSSIRRRRRSSSRGSGTPADVGAAQGRGGDISAVLLATSPLLTELFDGKLGVTIGGFFGRAVADMRRGMGRFDFAGKRCDKGDDGREGQDGTIGQAPLWARWTDTSEAETVDRKLESDLCWTQQVLHIEKKVTTELRRLSGLGVFPASEVAIIRRERESLASSEWRKVVEETDVLKQRETKEGGPYLSSTATAAASALPVHVSATTVNADNSDGGRRNVSDRSRSLLSRRHHRSSSNGSGSGNRRRSSSVSSRVKRWNASEFSTAAPAAAAAAAASEGGAFGATGATVGVTSCDVTGDDATGGRCSGELSEELEFSRLKMRLLKGRRQETERRRMMSRDQALGLGRREAHYHLRTQHPTAVGGRPSAPRATPNEMLRSASLFPSSTVWGESDSPPALEQTAFFSGSGISRAHGHQRQQQQQQPQHQQHQQHLKDRSLSYHREQDDE